MEISPAAQPLVSIGIPLYNGRAFIADTIASVLAQTYSNWEMVITDDGSSDGSAECAETFHDARIRVLRNESRLGPEGNWNRAISLGRGVYRKLLCHDDLLHPRCLERQVAAFESAGGESLALVTCARSISDARGSILMTRRWFGCDRRLSAANAQKRIIRSGTNLVGEPSAVLFRARDGEQLGGFDARWPYVVDLDYWFRLLQLGDLQYLAEPLCTFRVSDQSWSFQLARRQSAQFAALARMRHAANPGQISAFDLQYGIWKSRGLAVLRRLLYRWIARHPKRGPGQTAD